MSYNKNTDYTALIDKAVAKGDYKSAAQYESQRNEKVIGEGLTQYKVTSDYAPYLDTYHSNYAKQLTDASNAVSGIQDFSFDPRTNDLWKSTQNQYTRNASRAIRDTMASSAAQTGGLSSSYTTSAAAQAGQNYMSQMNDAMGDVYNLALQSWQANNAAKQNKLSALQSLNESAYNMYANDRSYLSSKSQDEFDNAMAKWQASGVLDAASAKILGLKPGTLYSDYAKWKEELAEARYEAQLAAQK